MAILPYRQRLLSRLLICSGAIAAFLAWPVGAQAQNNSAFHEIETKYIFGNFTVGSSTGLQGEMAFEPESEADFGKRFGNYVATGTALEFEYTPTQFMQVEFGPTVSYYNINNVPGLDNRNMLSVNGFESAFRFLLVEHGPSPFAVTLSVEPEFHSLDETSGASVQNYGLETKIEADTELIKNRLFLAFNLLYEPETTGVATMGTTLGWSNEFDARHIIGARLPDLPEGRYRHRSLVFAPLRWRCLQLVHWRRRLSRPDLLLADRAQGAHQRGVGGSGRRERGRHRVPARSHRLFPRASSFAGRVRILEFFGGA